jgi:uncharacterized RDD family membrane protein YckC
VLPHASGSSDPTDVIGRRIGAAIIDSIVGLVLMVAIGVPVLIAVIDGTPRSSAFEAEQICDRINQTRTTTPTGEPIGPQVRDDDDRMCIPWNDRTYIFDVGDIFQIYVVFFLLSFVSGTLNTVVLQGLKGGTVGKLAVGLRVVREDGSNAGIGACILRTIVGIADGQCFIGLILMCTTKGHRRLADMAARTFVIDRAHVGRPVLIPGLTAPAAMYGYGYGYGYGPPGQGYAPPPPTPDAPRWDPDRDTYIQYDRSTSAWVQWDAEQGQWVPIRT